MKDGPIVVGVDGSPGSRAALRVAAEEARAHGRALRVVMVYGYLEQHHARGATAFDPAYNEDDAKEALGEIKRFRPDVLVSDIGMPGEDGYALLRKVRDLPRELGGATPAIALTGFSGDAERAASRRAGYQAVTGKPVNLEELFTAIATLAARHSAP